MSAYYSCTRKQIFFLGGTQILFVSAIEMNVDVCFSLIVPLKAMRDDQSLVHMLVYCTLCLCVTVIRGHGVHVLQ